MDIFINYNDDNDSIKIPILPESFEISASQNNTSLYIHNLGEINLKGKRGLYAVSFESFFPHQRYQFAHDSYHNPYTYYCKKLKSLFENNKTVHLVITDTDINMYCTIESFTHGEEDRNGDVKYSISFKEYRELTKQQRTSTKQKETSYVWKKGDTWSKVVKKCTGSSNNWKTIRKNNKSVVTKAVKAYKKKHKLVKKIDEAKALVGYKVVIK